MQLTLDRREIHLSSALLDTPHLIADLPVGDILCEYNDGRAPWVAERKTAHDLASSIKSGRWSKNKIQLDTYPENLYYPDSYIKTPFSYSLHIKPFASSV